MKIGNMFLYFIVFISVFVVSNCYSAVECSGVVPTYCTLYITYPYTECSGNSSDCNDDVHNLPGCGCYQNSSGDCVPSSGSDADSSGGQCCEYPYNGANCQASGYYNNESAQCFNGGCSAWCSQNGCTNTAPEPYPS